jgi:AcrR family transcriptional regulator
MSSPERDEPGSRRERPAEPLGRDRIVAAAIAILEAEGLEALTMRRVAAALGTGAMSLYRHVASREELLDLVLDDLSRQIPASRTSGDWRMDATALAYDVRSALLRRRDLTLLLTARTGAGRADLPRLDHALGIFRGAGLGPRDAAFANHALGTYVSGACAWEAAGLGGSAEPAERRARADEATAFLRTLSPAEYPNVAAVADELFAGNAEDRFGYGLACLLDGIAARLPAR